MKVHGYEITTDIRHKLQCHMERPEGFTAASMEPVARAALVASGVPESDILRDFTAMRVVDRTIQDAKKRGAITLIKTGRARPYWQWNTGYRNTPKT